ncbi:MAG: lipopolysaccharide kinase InaA family protein [Dysgonomonas sp.]|nr:lipopolysaccharide kinase InaA family protein [Dysgonomonas sp.]
MSKIKTVISPEYEANPLVKSFITELPTIFENSGEILYAERNLIKKYELDKSDNILNEVVVKRYKRPNSIQKIIYGFFRSSKAERAFHNATELRKRGISTPREIAYIEITKNGLFEYGYYISGSDNAPPIRERLIELEDFDRTMAKDFAKFAAILHKKGILHGDLNSTNVLYHSEKNEYTFSVIDINRMKFFDEGTIIPKEECFDNLTRFTGRMDLYEFVLNSYIKERNWDIEADLKEAINIKKLHDEQWKRRKSFLRKLSLKKNKS